MEGQLELRRTGVDRHDKDHVDCVGDFISDCFGRCPRRNSNRGTHPMLADQGNSIHVFIYTRQLESVWESLQDQPVASKWNV